MSIDKVAASPAINGSLGGKRRAEVLAPEKRSEIARAAAAARWQLPELDFPHFPKS